MIKIVNGFEWMIFVCFSFKQNKILKKLTKILKTVRGTGNTSVNKIPIILQFTLCICAPADSSTITWDV